MKLVGNLQGIKTSRDDKNKDIEIHIDRIEYITSKKDGRYFQEFDLEEELDTPLVITGDCLARANTKQLEEGEHEFIVFDKVGDTYELNPNKQLSVTTVYDYDADLNILSSAYYTVTVSNEEYKQIKTTLHKDRLAKKGKGKKKNK